MLEEPFSNSAPDGRRDDRFFGARPVLGVDYMRSSPGDCELNSATMEAGADTMSALVQS